MPPLATIAALAGLWWLLSGGAPASWLVGIPTVAAAAWAAHALAAPRQRGMSPGGLLRFAVFFIRESVRGGVDVVTRVTAREPRIAPGFIDYRLRLAGPSAQLLFTNVLSLLPGTLAADRDGALLRVHALDVGSDLETGLRDLEAAVASLYGERL